LRSPPTHSRIKITLLGVKQWVSSGGHLEVLAADDDLVQGVALVLELAQDGSEDVFLRGGAALWAECCGGGGVALELEAGVLHAGVEGVVEQARARGSGLRVGHLFQCSSVRVCCGGRVLCSGTQTVVPDCSNPRGRCTL